MAKIDDQALVAILKEILGELASGPVPVHGKQDSMEEFIRRIDERRARVRATVASLQESLDQLRLMVKYLLFDLEATRRENNYLREMLERQDPGDFQSS